ncbi:MAG: fumarate reductase subunit C [Proteobacteria bacterium]|nr:fumarate reductase subunit C [Pseudomonadota bacterium]
MSSYRKPYIRKVKRSWWLDKKPYCIYMIREASAVLHLWIACELLTIVIAAAFIDTPVPWIAHFVQNPIVIFLNILAFPFTLIHLVTWYNIFPKGIRLFRSNRPDETRLIPQSLLIVLCYLLTIIASAMIICALALA